jgi:hypothetical protein
MAYAATVEDREERRQKLRGRGWSELALVAGAYIAYTVLRVVVEGPRDTAIENAHRVLSLERTLGMDWERSAQQWMLDWSIAVRFWNFVYAWLYWAVVAVALLVLWRVDRARYLLLRNTLMIAAAAGLIIFALFPTSPPRFLDGYVDTLAAEGDRLLAERSAFVNEYAAVPSFHVGWPAVAGLILAWRSTRVSVWLAALAPAVLLALAVVFTGNHFVFDIAAGVAVSLAALFVACIVTPPIAVTRDEVLADPRTTDPRDAR